MIKKRLVAATAVATLAPLTLAACGGGSNDAGSESSATENVSSLTVLDYYNDEPNKSNEKILESVQMAWHEEFQDSQS